MSVNTIVDVVVFRLYEGYHSIKDFRGVSTGIKRIQILSAGLRVDSPWISPRHPWRGERVENTVDVRASHTTGFPH